MILFIIPIGCKNQGRTEHRLLFKGNFVKLFDDIGNTIDSTKLAPNMTKLLYVKYDEKLNQKDKIAGVEVKNYIIKNLKNGKDKVIYSVRNSTSDDTYNSITYGWQPDSKYITFLHRSVSGNKSKIKILNINSDSGEIKQAHMPKLNFFFSHYRNDSNDYFDWSPDGKKILLVTEHAKGSVHVTTVYLYDIKRDVIKENFKTINNIGVIIWTKDSEQYTLSIQDTSHGQNRYDLPIIDVYAPTSIWLKSLNRNIVEILHNNKYESYYSVEDWSPKGWILFISGALGKENRQYLFNLETKKIYTMDLPKKLKNGTIIGWSKNGKDLLVVNTEGVWSLDFESIPKRKTSI